MANNKSAKKRICINKRNRLRNRFYKSSLKTLMKKFLKELSISKESKNPIDREKVQKTFNSLYSLIDKATKKNVFHKNNAARKKAQLINYLRIK